MLLVVSLEILGFVLSEWVIQWSCSLNEKAIPLGTIHIVHNHFMGMEGNSLLPFDRMVWEWKQNHWINQGKSSVQHSSLVHQFSTGWFSTTWEKGGKISIPSDTVRHGSYHLKLPIQKLTHKPSSFVPWTW